MATVRARRAGTPEGRGRPGAGRPSPLPLTLAELITAVQDVVGPGGDRLVVATVCHLLRTGRLTMRGSDTRRPGSARAGVLALCEGKGQPPAQWHAGGSAVSVQVAEDKGERPGL
jgi:hypothetical protein